MQKLKGDPNNANDCSMWGLMRLSDAIKGCDNRISKEEASRKLLALPAPPPPEISADFPEPTGTQTGTCTLKNIIVNLKSSFSRHI